MTALTKYQRLEAPGIWRPGPGAQRRDVVAVLGKASLTLMDSRTDSVLAHWSLPAVHRLNPGVRPALYGPGKVAESRDGDGDGAEGESLELDDALMVEALESIDRALRPPARRGWLRRGVGAGSVALVALLAVFWLPPALVDHTAGIVPQASRAQIARAVIDTLPADAPGAGVCAHPGGRQALATLRARVLGGSHRALAIAGVPGFEATHLPGQVIVLGADLLARLDSPEALAGYLIAEDEAAQAEDPLRDILRHAGFRATLSLLTTGSLPAGALAGYLPARLAAGPARPDPAALAGRLAADGLPVAPYADALGANPARAELARQAEALRTQAITPNPAQEPAGRLLGDGEWLMLQAVCDG